MSYKFPDEVADGYIPRDRVGWAPPMFTGPRSGKANASWCKLRPWDPYCDQKRRPQCYTSRGRKHYYYFKKNLCIKPKEGNHSPRYRMPYKRKRGAMRKRRYTKKQRKTYKRKQTKKSKCSSCSGGRVGSARQGTMQLLKAVPFWVKSSTHQFIVTGLQNQKQHVYGTERLNLYCPWELSQNIPITAIAGAQDKVYLAKAKLFMQITNFANTSANVSVWKFTPRNDYYLSRDPDSTFKQGLADLDDTGTGEFKHMASPYKSSDMVANFKIKRVSNFTLEQGQEKNFVFTKAPNKIFNVDKFTTPGTTSFMSVITAGDHNKSWFKGLTEFYGISVLGRLHDVTNGGTGGVAGVGYADSRLGVLLQKTYYCKNVETTTQDKYIYEGGDLGKAGTGTGQARVQNKDTGVTSFTYFNGVSQNNTSG